METARVNGVHLHFADKGMRNGPAVVFCNSLGTNLRVWDGLLPHLPQGLRILRYDKRGHGLSEETPGPYAIDQLADDAAALIRDRGLGRAVFVGDQRYRYPCDRAVAPSARAWLSHRPGARTQY